MTIQELREKREKLIYDARQLVERSINSGTPLSADDKATIDKLRADATAIGDQLRLAEDLSAEERAIQEARAVVPVSQGGGKAEAKHDVNDAFRRFMVTGERREQSLTAAEGGYTVAPDVSFYGKVIEAKKLYGGLESAPVTVINTKTGADVPIPTVDDTANTAYIVAEAGSHASGTAVVVGQTTLKAYVASTKIVKVSKQLLQDSEIAWEGFLAGIFGKRLARYRNSLLTTGTGSSQPQGAQYASTTGRTCATGFTTSPAADDLIRLIHAVDPEYRNPQVARFMFNDGTALILRLLKDGDGQYLWKSGLMDAQPDRLLGFPVVINPDMPAMTASLKPVIFGDFSTYVVRNVMGMEVIRLNELYAANGQIGFMATERFDGALLDAGQHPIQGLVMAAS